VLRRPVRRTRSGRYQLHLSAEERDLLRSLPGQLQELLGTDDPSLRRLFPPAYADDPEHDAEYQRLMRDDLLERHRAALDVMAATVDATELDADQLAGWLSALNDLRLVLGTQLNVTEDDVGGGGTVLHEVYLYLTYLEESVVETLAGW
jgi:hypothetical protein